MHPAREQRTLVELSWLLWNLDNAKPGVPWLRMAGSNGKRLIAPEYAEVLRYGMMSYADKAGRFSVYQATWARHFFGTANKRSSVFRAVKLAERYSLLTVERPQGNNEKTRKKLTYTIHPGLLENPWPKEGGTE